MENKEDQKKDWAEMSDEEEHEVAAKEEGDKPQHTIKQSKKKTQQKGFKNDRGDYVVTSILIPELQKKEKKAEESEEEESDSDEGYDEEDDTKEQAQANAAAAKGK
mmetsp:Transcript_16299/g.25184  ORF Transcript_16299/g.25184 Transcript_16299/m.25184 type:complete len:106 (-) Transcript_16299:587-904(-)